MKTTAFLLSLLLIPACSGLQANDGVFSAHAESLVILGMEIPGDDFAAAHEELAEIPNAKITSVYSSPDDWTSLVGIISNILGIHFTTIGGTYGD